MAWRAGGLFLAAGVIGIVSTLALTQTAAADPPEKETICHNAGNSGNTVQITVSKNAGTENKGNGGHLPDKHQDDKDAKVANGPVGGRGAEVFKGSSSCVSTTNNPPPVVVINPPPVIDNNPPPVIINNPPQVVINNPPPVVIEAPVVIQQAAPVIVQSAPVPQAPVIVQPAAPPVRQAEVAGVQAPAPIQRQAVQSAAAEAPARLPTAGSGGYLSQSLDSPVIDVFAWLGLLLSTGLLVLGTMQRQRAA